VLAIYRKTVMQLPSSISSDVRKRRIKVRPRRYLTPGRRRFTGMLLSSSLGICVFLSCEVTEPEVIRGMKGSCYEMGLHVRRHFDVAGCAENFSTVNRKKDRVVTGVVIGVTTQTGVFDA